MTSASKAAALIGFGSWLGLAPSRAAAADTGAKEQAAIAVAQAWLALVDAEKYHQSWAEAAQLFRSGIDADGWSRQAGAVRRTLGAVVKRELTSRKYATRVPGAPDGEYVVIEYRTSFGNKSTVVETVTPTLEKDGKWRVSGYYIL